MTSLKALDACIKRLAGHDLRHVAAVDITVVVVGRQPALEATAAATWRKRRAERQRQAGRIAASA